MGYLAQEHEAPPGETVRHNLARRTGARGAETELAEAAAGLTAGGSAAERRYEVALERFNGLGVGDLDARIDAVLDEIGLGVDLADRAVSALSGGQRARVALAGIELSHFDLTLLDEPTNDLDFEGLERLEGWVRSLRGGLVIVSHDREFLARTITSVLELDEHTRTAHEYGGGWGGYQEERANVRRHATEAYELYRRQRGSSRAGPNGSGSGPPPGSVGRAANPGITTRRSGTSGSTAPKSWRPRPVRPTGPVRRSRWWRSRGRGGTCTSPSRRRPAPARWWPGCRGGDRTGTVPHGAAGSRDHLGRPGGAHGGQRDRKVHVGRRPPGSPPAGVGPAVARAERGGGRVGPGPPGHRGGRTPSTWSRTGSPEPDHGPVRDPRPRPGRCWPSSGWRQGHVTRPAGSLSPGERTRAELAVFQARGVNLLVLDEPTNHLDLPAIEQLE